MCFFMSSRGTRNSVIGIEDFDRVVMRAGTVVDVGINKNARKPAYKLRTLEKIIFHF